MPVPASASAALPEDVSAGPSLAETTTWLSANLIHLKSNYVAVYTYVPVPKKKRKRTQPLHDYISTSDSVTAAAMVGCHLSISLLHSTTTDSGIVATVSTFDVPLQQTRFVALGVVEHPFASEHGYKEQITPAFSNQIHIEARSAVIKRTDTVTRGEGDKTQSVTDSALTRHLEIETDDIVLGGRIERALNYASHMCEATLGSESF